MKTRPISLLELIDTIELWSQFWGEPYVLRNNVTERETWAKHYLTGLNSSKMARKHWYAAKERVFATCDRFPWPCDVIAAAREVEKGVDIEEMQRSDSRKRHDEGYAQAQQSTDEMPATPEQVDQMVNSFIEKNNGGEG